MPEALQEQVKNHLATFPDFKDDFHEMKTEWQQFKNKAFWTMVSFAVGILSIGIWVGTIQSQHSSFDDDINNSMVKNASLEAKINTLEVNNSEIRARLTSIDLALQEIKLSIKELR